jgi:hypothetical protein
MRNGKSTIVAIALMAAMAATPTVPTYAQQTASAAQGAIVILTADGKLPDGKRIELSLADLERLPRTAIRTTTPWHDGEQHFEGVLLADLVSHLGAKGETMQVVALNKYRTMIPVSDFLKHRPILAFKRNGSTMGVKDKGPLFVIYPYDADLSLRNELYFGRSAWQVRTITFE